MTSLQLHRLMSITDEALQSLSKSDPKKYSALKKKFDALQDELYGNPIK